MATITVVHRTCVEIYDSDQHRCKRTVLIIDRQSLVQAGGYIGRREALLGHHSEEIDDHRHRHRCRHALA